MVSAVQCDEELGDSCLRQRQTHEAYTVNLIDPGSAFIQQCPHENDEQPREGAGSAQPVHCSTSTELGSPALPSHGRETYSHGTFGNRFESSGSIVVVESISEDGVRTESLAWGSREVRSQEHSAVHQSTQPFGSDHSVRRRDYSTWPFTPPAPAADVPKPPFHLNMSEAALIADLQSAVYCAVCSSLLLILRTFHVLQLPRELPPMHQLAGLCTPFLATSFQKGASCPQAEAGSFSVPGSTFFSQII